LNFVRSKTEDCEAQLKRNNLKFQGIQGKIDEPWHITEGKVREFIKTELNLPELENVDIERAHRMKSRDENTCIIVKFTKYKDRDQILSRARRNLGNTRYSVHKDFIERVKVHRRELGKRLVQERERGNYAAMSYDKLIIENTVYGYDEMNENVFEIGRARGQPSTRFHKRLSRGRGAERRDGGSTRAPGRASPLASEQASATDDVA